MKIELISKEDHAKLLEIYNNYPALTLQNKGYEPLKNESLSPEEKEKFKEAEAILRKSIIGFRSFTNFKLSTTEKIQIRFQYNYNYDGGLPFSGVGYILLDELLNGFKN